MPTSEDVYTELRQVYDPEIPVNVVDLGLIYDVKVTNETCNITMTLTAKSCPEAQNIPVVIKRRVTEIEGIGECEVEIVWEPAWSPQLISPNGRKILGLPDEDAPAEGAPAAGAPASSPPAAGSPAGGTPYPPPQDD